MAIVCFPCNIQRAIYHPQWKAESPSPSHKVKALQMVSNIQKNWEEFRKSERSYRQWCWIMHKGGKRIAFRLLQVPIRSQWVWGYDADGTHVSHQIIRHVGSYLKFKGLLLSYLLKIYQVISSVPNSLQKAIQNSSPSIIRNLIPIWYLFFHSFVFDLFIVSALVCPSEKVILSQCSCG